MATKTSHVGNKVENQTWSATQTRVERTLRDSRNAAVSREFLFDLAFISA